MIFFKIKSYFFTHVNKDTYMLFYEITKNIRRFRNIRMWVVQFGTSYDINKDIKLMAVSSREVNFFNLVDLVSDKASILLRLLFISIQYLKKLI